jgi:ABC-2 type transport system permease protein
MANGRAGTGSIYDLGYRRYSGDRLGRRYAVLSLYTYSLKAIFGLGRSAMSKVFPIGLAIVLMLPAVVQLGIAAIAPREVTIIKHENYFGFTQIVLVLFCAATAPEIVGRDQRFHTLPLYFSRALSRLDYVSSKVVALFAALFLVTFVPQVLLFLGSAVATEDLVSYITSNIDIVPPVLGSSMLVAALMSSVSLAIGSQTHRRAFATGAILAFFVIFNVLGSILVETTTGEAQKYSLLIAPVITAEGAVRWIFGAAAPSGSVLAKSGLAGWACFVALFGYIALALGVLYRRFQRLAA